MAPNQEANPDDVAALIAAMSRDEITDALVHFESKPPLDFSPSYLAGLSLDKLRHLLWTAILCLTPTGSHPTTNL